MDDFVNKLYFCLLNNSIATAGHIKNRLFSLVLINFL